ncbi:aminotransferase class V-fold PLP-dependent enzyme [Clostridium sp. MCC353]|uniref:cysteine desulfurase family protein n=1 Tax=Clostridium sp. MCC353 TaxID=2592646 RepID=UPI001C038D9B|nr:cysteine desulfurase family protein [Clostridium sp. MCC353]MBT9779553.1 aminotransferase class V-fold PLP-dependent enzyme [Clostridium sp. MCC353]
MIYADYAATTPVRPEVLEAMIPYFTGHYFNPSSVYREGREAALAVENARRITASCLNAGEDEILFTSGGTESDNLAVKGTALHPDNKRRHIITSSTEHHAVLESCRFLEQYGFTVTYLPVDRLGRVRKETLEAAFTPDTFLVSIMWVNNETGVIQDIKTLADAAHRHGCLFHTDAVQAMGTQTVDVKATGVDLLSFSAHKIYGPKGCGALYCRKGVPLKRLISGGQQERYLRAGTENVPAVAGFGKAVELLASERERDAAAMESLKTMMLNRLEGRNGILVNSPAAACVPSILNLGFREIEAEGLVFHLSRQGILVSMGAACDTKSVEPSHVLKAMGVPEEYLRGCIRISLGHGMKREEVELLCGRLLETVERIGGLADG